MRNAALAGVVMGYSVIFIGDGFARPVCRRCNCGLAFATADNFNAAMVDGDSLLLSVLVEYVLV